MSTTVYKGGIKAGAITARFMSDYSNVDSDLLVISYAPRGGGIPLVDQAATVPGGSADVAIHPDKQGLLEVWVVTGQANDSGRLHVMGEGATAHDEPILGPVRWVYSVEGA